MSNDELLCGTERSEDLGDVAEGTLVKEMIAGNERAWRAFHARYDRLVHRCIAGVIARFSAVVAQDDIRDIHATLLMQLLSNDMRKLRTFDPERGTRLSSWIGTLAVRCAYDHLRGARRSPRCAPLDDAAVELPCERPSPQEHAERRERAALVGQVLHDFSDKDREFVALYFGEGLPPEQIAERMRISVKTVYTKRHKIQSRLEAMLSDTRIAA
ncbi:sigma-70 family RNA polymerase sigma factor [Sorangium sp. So ce315]|uniref:RNA polymerase sigma factor n=1 Tax=Sorangium sp. So ce315 TaxID=3133299 RepID=UPI003F5D8125